MDDCEKFLARQEPWVRAALKGEYESSEIGPALVEPGGIETFFKARDEYEEILKHCRKHLREYRKHEAKRGAEAALFGVPSVPVGAPPKDWLAREARELHAAGMSQPAIARELNKRHPGLQDRKGNVRPITSEVVRHHLSSLRRRGIPEKT